jgi:hypothetical protein
MGNGATGFLRDQLYYIWTTQRWVEVNDELDNSFVGKRLLLNRRADPEIS